MDQLARQQNAIQTLIRNYANYGASSDQDDVETQFVFDSEHHHYQLVYVGWEHQRRVYGCVLHFDIKDSKIWIQYNGTEVDVAEELVNLGITKDEIVIGFHSPIKRRLTDYAVG